MSIYNTAVEKARKGVHVSIDLKSKTMTFGKKVIIENGEVKTEESLLGENSSNPWDEVEALYQNFKLSVPSKKEKKSYFYACSAEQLSLAELAYGEEREVARVKLEAYILCAALAGVLVWDFGDTWFYKGQDEHLVVLKEYIS